MLTPAANSAGVMNVILSRRHLFGIDAMTGLNTCLTMLMKPRYLWKDIYFGLLDLLGTDSTGNDICAAFQDLPNNTKKNAQETHTYGMPIASQPLVMRDSFHFVLG
ncbi:hypothetical protein U9M48_036703 [Paspalum notatum var. saurae]|uniref:Uncharacterized protein n=1 Tax=Paspalum notatum var. saurae TaxID=547442 RepID=A0AAQ3UHR5_PASNO